MNNVFIYPYGAKLSKIDLRDYKLKVSGIANLPEEFELSYVPKTKNQGSINSCVAHAVSSVEEYFEKVQCDDESELSPGYIYGTRYDYKGQGMYLRDALKTLLNKGICKQIKFPYNLEVPDIIEKLNSSNISEIDTEHRKITRYFRLKNVKEIKKAIYEHGPVVGSIYWHYDNKLNNNVIIEGTDNSNYSGYHCIYFYGWDKTGFKILNSWGKKWANKGTAILPYSYSIEEAYGIEDTYLKSEDIVIPVKNNFIDILLKLLNKLLNIIFKKGD